MFKNFKRQMERMLSKPCFTCGGKMIHKTRKNISTEKVESYYECNRCGSFRKKK